MSAQIIDGCAVATNILDNVVRERAQFTRAHGRRPCLVTVLVGEDPAWHTHVRMKRNWCAEAGMESRYVELPSENSTAELVAEITTLSEDPNVDGSLLQPDTWTHRRTRGVRGDRTG